MKKILSVSCILVLLIAAGSEAFARQRVLLPEQQVLLDTFVWYPSPNPNGSSSVSFKLGGKLIYIDPVILPELVPALAKADVILITHTHQDHYSPAVIQALSGPATILIGVKDMKGAFKGALLMLPGDRQEVAGLTVRAYPAYNNGHSRIQDWLAFTITDGKQTVFISGDTDMHVEFRGIANIDVAVFFINPPLTLPVADALKMAKVINPASIVPVHWNSGMEDLIAGFSKKAGSRSLVRVLEKYGN